MWIWLQEFIPWDTRSAGGAGGTPLLQSLLDSCGQQGWGRKLLLWEELPGAEAQELQGRA